MKTKILFFLLLSVAILSAKTFSSPQDFTNALTKVSVPDTLQIVQDTTKTMSKTPQKIALKSDRVPFDMSNLSPNFNKIIDRINVKDMELRDLLRGLSFQYDINLAVDNSISQQVTLSLSNLTVQNCLEFLCLEYGLQITLRGTVLKIAPIPKAIPVQSSPDDMAVKIKDNLLSVDIRNKDISDVVHKLALLNGKNLVLQNGVSGQISAYFNNIAFDAGLDILMENNGFKVRKKDGVYYISYGQQVAQAAGRDNQRKTLWVSYDQGKISFDLENADLAQVIKEIAGQIDTNIITYGEPVGKVTAKCNGFDLDEALNYLLKGTDYTFKHDANVYIIGDKKNSSLVTSRLIKLKHIKSEGILDILPESLKKNATIEIIKEQNALMVLGTNDLISDIESYLNQIDSPTAQILIEALVVDFNTSDIRELGLKFGNTHATGDSLPFQNIGQLDLGVTSNGGFSAQLNGQYLNPRLTDFSNWAGVANLGHLPQDFYVKVQALENQGKANIRSRPQIATLNGHKASISIGTTQYYILKTVTPISSADNIVAQQSERFEQVEANVTLSIVPWVSASGDVTVEIHPEFKTPVGILNSSTPPTINTRVLDSTVRLKDGETIILGGLIQDSDTRTYSKVPLLGDIPFLGKLFRTSSKNKGKSELMIYITPHVFYGDETDNDKWNTLRKTNPDTNGTK